MIPGTSTGWSVVSLGLLVNQTSQSNKVATCGAYSWWTVAKRIPITAVHTLSLSIHLSFFQRALAAATHRLAFLSVSNLSLYFVHPNFKGATQTTSGTRFVKFPVLLKRSTDTSFARSRPRWRRKGSSVANQATSGTTAAAGGGRAGAAAGDENTEAPSEGAAGATPDWIKNIGGEFDK